MQLNRRGFLAGTAAVVSAAATVRVCAQQGGDADLQALLARQYEASLKLSPEEAAFVGIDTGERSGLRAIFSDVSARGEAARHLLREQQAAELERFPETGLSENGRLERDVSLYRLTTRNALDTFGYHIEGFAPPGPYGVSQLGGAYSTAPRLLSDLHPVENKADADAYVSRLSALAAVIDGETDHMQRNAVAGVVAPRFVLEQAAALVAAVAEADPSQTPMVRSLAEKAATKELTGYEVQAQRLFEGPIRAALVRQADWLRTQAPRAGTAAGVGRLPRGEDYYAAMIRYTASSSMTPDEVHRTGLEQVAALTAEIDRILRAQGLTKGSVKDRAVAFGRAPGQAFPNTEEGRGAILAYMNERLEALGPRLPRMFGRLPKSGYAVRRLPAEIEAGAPGAQAQPATADGRPGIVYVNLRDTADWPRYALPTLAFHEGTPGHLFEGALTQEAGELPLYRRGWFFSGYAEGWALYAEQLAAELGMYEDDPTGRIGYLFGYLFRAARLVVDTGLHIRGWSREQAIDYLYANSSDSRESCQREVDRYIVMPGQATGYKLGHTVFTRLRAEAQRSLEFDIRTFHDFILAGGNLPLDLLERRVRARFAS